jgi:multidrug efflux pump subunit AcrB
MGFPKANGPPLMVMAIIHSDLIGTICNHAAWDIPLSMFTVVSCSAWGIIINDSIVMVKTIDEYAETAR